jgi:hypothetical protein
MSFPEIDEAHHKLVTAKADLTKPGANPIPISLVSVDEREAAQLVVFDGLKWPKGVVVARLRAAADFLESQP